MEGVQLQFAPQRHVAEESLHGLFSSLGGEMGGLVSRLRLLGVSWESILQVLWNYAKPLAIQKLKELIAWLEANPLTPVIGNGGVEVPPGGSATIGLFEPKRRDEEKRDCKRQHGTHGYSVGCSYGGPAS